MIDKKILPKSRSFASQKREFEVIAYKNIKVYYLSELNGGGMTFVSDYGKLVSEKFKEVGKLCEFASGPGFIGFSLLAEGLCKKLSLIDINPLAVEACKKTIISNGLKNKAKVFLSDGFKNVPKSEKWDLVVGNLPHFNGTKNDYRQSLSANKQSKIFIDPGWAIHKDFYSNVGKHLNPGGTILLVENYKGSKPRYWPQIITRNDLRYVGIFGQKWDFTKLFAAISHLFVAIIQKYLTPSDLNNGLDLNVVDKSLLHMLFPHYFVWSRKEFKEKDELQAFNNI